MDPAIMLAVALTTLSGTTILAMVGLRAFQAWIELKRFELDRTASSREPALPNAAARIDVADLKERIRKLEAIAAGVEL